MENSTDNLLNDIESLGLSTVNIQWAYPDLKAKQKFEEEINKYRTINGQRISKFIKNADGTRLTITFTKDYFIIIKKNHHLRSFVLYISTPTVQGGRYMQISDDVYLRIRKILSYENVFAPMLETEGVIETGKLDTHPKIYIELLKLLEINIDNINGIINTKSIEFIDDRLISGLALIKTQINSNYGLDIGHGHSTTIRMFSGGLILNPTVIT